MRILITAGPTREYLDDVRFISNASSGRMGYAIAAEGVRRGHQVVLVSGPVELAPPGGVEFVPVVSAQEMLHACLSRFESCDAAIMCAAVSDYRPAARSPGKAPKIEGALQLTLEPTPDICATLGKMKGRRLVIGFALETHDGRRKAEAKLHHKHCDAIVLNAPSAIGGETTTIEIFAPRTGWSAPQTLDKADAASRLLALIDALTGPGRRRG